VFNFDETRLVQKNAKLVLRRIEAANNGRTNVRSTRNRTVASLLTFVAANRSVLLSVYILKGRFRDDGEATVDLNLEHAPRVTRGIWPRYYVWNDTRYVEADTFKPVLTKGAEEFHALYPCMSARLFGDQLAANRRADIVEFATGLDLFLFSLAKNTSHMTQPLDEAPFATLQADRVRRNEVAIMDGMLTSTSSRDTLLMAACEAECRAFSRPIIIGAFRRRGLWPFDADLVKANVRANLGLVDSGGTAADAARHAATMVIQAAQDRVDQSKARPKNVKAVVQRGVVHFPFLLLARHQEMEAVPAKEAAAKVDRREKREQKKQQQEKLLVGKVAARETQRCRVSVSKVRRGGKTWVGCRCDEVRVFPECAKSLQAGLALAGHFNMCQGGGQSESEGDSGVGAGDSSSEDSE